MMHESGTGGAPKYGIVPQMPLTSVAPPVNLLDNITYSQPRVGLLSCATRNQSNENRWATTPPVWATSRQPCKTV
jgi:hypothetical protein